MAAYPATGSPNWAAPLKAYIDDADQNASRTADAPGLGIYFPEAHGALGGTTDDTAAIRTVLATASAAAGCVYFSQMHRITGNLYVYGAVSLYARSGSGAGLKLDSDLSTSDGTAYWINMGIQGKLGTVNTWTGAMENLVLQITANGPNNTRVINMHSVQTVVITGCTVDVRARGVCLNAGIGAVNNGAWCASPYRDHVVIDNNFLLAAENNVGDEAIDVSNGTNVWVTRNHITGWGDDCVALHAVDHFVIDSNICYTMDARLLADGSRWGQITNNQIQRVAIPGGTWASGGAMIYCQISDFTYPAPADIIISGNVVIHGTGITSTTYGIRVEGGRRITVSNNEIRDTSGFGLGVSWSSITGLTGWTDPEGLDSSGSPRTRDLLVYKNRTGGLAGGSGDANNVSTNIQHYDMTPVTVAVSSGGLTTTPSAGSTQLYVFTLGGNLTLGSPSLGYEGQQFTIRLIQDATGGRTVTWPSSTFIKFVGGAAPVNTAANGTVEVGFVLRGSVWVEQYRITY